MENLWKMIAEARSVELNEEFKWNGSIYKIADYDGLLVLYHSWLTLPTSKAGGFLVMKPKSISGIGV